MPSADVPVLVVGAGPTGLAASLTLSGLGVEHVIADHHAAPLHHPKAVAIMQRTAELLRAWGVEDEIRAHAVPKRFCEQMLWVTTLRGEELGRTPTPDPDAGGETSPSPCSAVLRCPQHVTEAVLRARAEAHDAARTRYGVHVAALAPDDDGVTATLVDRETGAEEPLRASWVIAADGNDSGIRSEAHIGRTGQDDMGHFINIFFRAPLGPLVTDRPAWSYAVLTPELVGTFVTLDGADEWILHRNLVAGERLEDFPPDRCVDVVRHAAGVPDLPVEIIGVRQWIMGAQLSTAFRAGRVVLTGDAAHRTTPDGGVGMNTGMASAHNAAWKVGAVAAGWAGPALLDTYEEERRAVAQRNVDYSAGRGEGMKRMAEAIRIGDLETVRAGIAARGTLPTRQGMDLGYTYASEAVVPDGTDPPELEDPMRDYVPTGRPGGRAPHVPLADGRSTLDLFGRGMVLLTDTAGEAWTRAAPEAAGAAPLDVHAVAGEPFEAAYGIEADGAVLVRPDGFVAWRSAGGSPRPDRDLASALDAVLAR